MLKPEYIFIWILFHLFAVELPKNLANRSKPKTPAYEQVQHMRYQKALNVYRSLNDVKLATEYRAIATALSKLNQNDSALVVFDKMALKFPNSIQNKDLLDLAIISRKLGKLQYSDSLISLLKAGEYSNLNVFDDVSDINFRSRYKKIDSAASNRKEYKFKSKFDHYGAVQNPSNNTWFYHAKDSIYDGLLNGISGADKKFYAQIYKSNNWNDSLIVNGPTLQDKVFNKYVELSHIDSFGNYYISMNNRLVNDSDKFLLQTYRYFYDTKRSKYVFEGLGLEQYTHNVSSFVLNASRTKGLFCSDQSGALGKSDIWICDVSFNKDGEISISNQTNLGPKVNTILSEADPTFITDEIIAFSSEGRLGFGGFDIYFYNLTTSEVANAGSVVNTTNDEYFPKYYNNTLNYSVTNKWNNNVIYSMDIPVDCISLATQTILPPSTAEPEVEPTPVETVVIASTTQAIQTTLDNVKKESLNKYDYARNLSFVLLSDSERIEAINKLDSTANYQDFKFMTLFHVDNEFVIEKEFEKELEIMAALLNKRPDWGMEIRSYTDSRGPQVKNQKLSQSRANYVAQYLEKKGVNPKQILPVGYGELRLINHCADGVPCTEEEHRQNRRTELIVTPVFFWSKVKK
jgi:outer membrane protein OmpA-like peptidoglycan-associated protein